MKNLLPITLFLALAAQVFAQTHPHLSQALKQYHSLLDKAIGHEPDLPTVDSTEFLPPFNQQTYHLTDSIYYYAYDSSVWDLTSKQYLENDCNLGRRLISTLYTDFQDIDSFELNERTEMAYYPDGTLKMRKYFKYSNNFLNKRDETDYYPDGTIKQHNYLEYYNNNWITTNYEFNSKDNQPSESWYKTYDPASGLFTDGTRTVATSDVATIYAWDSLSQDWVLARRFTNIINNGLVTQDLDEYYINGAWVLALKNEYDYYPNGQYKEIRGYWYDNGAVVFRARYTCTLDGNGDTVLEFIEGIDSTNTLWLPNYRQINTYASHQPIEELGQLFTNGVWVNFSKNTFSYYPNGDKHEESNSDWNDVGQLWVETYYQEFNEDGNILLRESHIGYDPITNTYYGASRKTYTYNAAGNILEAKTERLEHYTLDTYLPNTIINYEYDNEGAFLESIYQYWSEEDSVFVLSSKTHYFNTGCAFSSTTSPAVESAGCLFANPIHFGQSIQCTGLKEGAAAKLELYDLAGRLVHEQAFSQGDSFDPNRPLPTGLYIIFIYDDMGGNFRSKVLVLD